MHRYTLATLAAAGSLLGATSALAQDAPNRIEPYVGVVGTIHDFDDEANGEGLPPANYNSKQVGIVGGVNVPLGERFFVGAEGNGAKGVDGPIDWEYGVAARAGVRAGGGMFYGKVGRQWLNFDGAAPAGNNTYDGMTYGAGVEIAPGGEDSRLRLRGEMETFGDFRSIRPSVGVVLGF
jgi:outer membrane immunogenic protein